MPTWFYILMGCLVIIGVGGIAVAIVVGNKVKGKVCRLLADMQRDDAVVQSECMIRDGAIQCPGVALVAGETLIIQSVFGKSREIPLSDVCVTKEGPGLGKYGWFGKRVFYLDTPETTNLAIGVNNPEPWRIAFEKRKDS